MARSSTSSVILAVLAAICLVGCAQAQDVYRVVVITKWNVTSAADIAKVAKIEEGLVFPCTKWIIRGVMGYTAKLTPVDTASYAKVYDFKTMDDYNLYKACSNAIPKQTDAWQVGKARAAFKVPGSLPIPAAGKYATLGIGNATQTAATVAQIKSIQSTISCLYTVANAAVADAAGNTYLKAPTTTGYWAGYADKANLVAADWYTASLPPAVAKLAGLYGNNVVLRVGFQALKIK